jgi:hypothetical protein
MSKNNAPSVLFFHNHRFLPTVDIDFTNMGGVLDARFDFARSLAGTYINSAGLVAAGSPNTARFTHDPTTLAPLGLLIEGSTQNMLNFSETFATTGGVNNNWANVSLTRTSTNNTSPRGDATALRLTASATNGTMISTSSLGATLLFHTLSVWLRRVTGTGAVQFTLNNGTTWTTQAITTSWVRYTFPAVESSGKRVGFRVTTNNDAIEIWGAQLEQGNGSSSYIPTTTARVTRDADDCKIYNLERFKYSLLKGSLYLSGIITKNSVNNLIRAGFYNEGVDVQCLAFITREDANLESKVSDGTVVASTSFAYTKNTAYNFGLSYDNTLGASCLISCVNGANAQTSLDEVENTETPDTFIFGEAADGNFASGTIARVKYWPISKTAAELVAITL